MTLLDDLDAARAGLASLLDQDTSLHTKIADQRALIARLEATTMKGGPDVSKYQGDVDWNKVAGAGYDICFPKVSDGDLNDELWTASRVASVRAAGLSFAPYYYARVASDGNGQRTPRTEAAMAYYFASKAGWGRAGDLPLVYDVEANAGETNTFQGQAPDKAANHIVNFVKRYNGLTGHYPIIYTFPYAWSILLPSFTTDDKAILTKCALWIAHYTTGNPTIPAPWAGATFHQFTDKATVPGIANPCDLNKVLVSRAAVDGLRIG